MPYELRAAGKPPVTFETEAEAMAAAKAITLADPDAEPEVIDLTTGEPAAPGASKADRDDYATKVGF